MEDPYEARPQYTQKFDDFNGYRLISTWAIEISNLL